MQRYLIALCLVALGAGCVPADEAMPLGSAQFTVTGRGSARLFGPDTVLDGWTIHVDRFVLSFRTMTIVNLQNSDQCAYRGRGAVTNVVFDGTEGSVVQAFNGIKAGACPDVGLRLAPPDDRTVVGDGATAADLVSLISGRPAHAMLLATATRPAQPPFDVEDEVLRLSLRFETVTASSAFGGCRDAVRGVRLLAEAREAVLVSFAAEVVFREALFPNAPLRFDPFADADALGNADGIVTTDEIDAMSLAAVEARYGPGYRLADGLGARSFGDYVRQQFAAAVQYGNGGQCDGIPAGTETD